ncbi:MAG: hypothetical protein AAF146_04345 [Bacteroidota bacterium]
MKMSLMALAAVLLLWSCTGDAAQNGEGAAAEPTTMESSADNAAPTTNTAEPGTDTTERVERMPVTQEQADLMNRLRGYDGNISPVRPLPAEDIKALMPTKLVGLAIYENEGETNLGFDSPTTFVVAIYRDGYEIIKIAVTDTGGSPSTMMAVAPWANQNLNRETARGFDRSTTYKKYPAHERYNTEAKVGVFEYVMDMRYVVSMDGKNQTVEQMRAAADELNLDRLIEMGKKK